MSDVSSYLAKHNLSSLQQISASECWLLSKPAVVRLLSCELLHVLPCINTTCYCWQVAVPAGTELPISDSRPSSAGLRGKSAPAAFGSVSKLNGAPEPWQRGRPHTVKRLSPVKAARRSLGQRPPSPSSDTSSGLGTSAGSEGEDSSSGVEEAHAVRTSNRKVTFRENGLNDSRVTGRPKRMESPFDAAAQLAHPEGQGRLHTGSSPDPQRGLDWATNTVKLPRADIMVIGGDLAYPNPSNETYEQRFFRPFEAALPPPPHVRPGRLVVYKPDLPGAADMCHTSSSGQQATNAHGAPYNPSR